MKIHHYGLKSQKPLCGTDLVGRLGFSKTHDIDLVTCETCLNILSSIKMNNKSKSKTELIKRCEQSIQEINIGIGISQKFLSELGNLHQVWARAADRLEETVKELKKK